MVNDPAAPRDLYRLRDLRYGVAAGEPDVRGWPVYSSTGRPLGAVADMLVDDDAAEVLMLEIEGAGGLMVASVRDTWIDGTAQRVVLDARALATPPDVTPTGAASVDPAPGDQSPTGTAAPGVNPTERRTSRVDDASDLDDAAGIDARELDARVRIEEGGTVDDEAPVAGVRYEGGEETPHNYGRPDEAYGPEYGDGRIGFDKVVSRDPARAATDAVDATSAEPPGASGPIGERGRVVRFRRYPDAYAGPDAVR